MDSGIDIELFCNNRDILVDNIGQLQSVVKQGVDIIVKLVDYNRHDKESYTEEQI